MSNDNTIFHAAHYNALAKEIRELFPIEGINAPDDTTNVMVRLNLFVERGTLAALALALCKRFQNDNPRFDPIKFLTACSPNNDLYPLSELWEGDQLG